MLLKINNKIIIKNNKLIKNILINGFYCKIKRCGNMNKDYIINNYKFEKLSEKHDLSRFDCGNNDLNDFIKNDALNQQEDNLSATKVVICDGEIIGFFSLLSDSIELKKIRDEKTKKSIKIHLPRVKKAPAIKIGRFAIDKKYSNKGIGSNIMEHILLNILELTADVGMRFVLIEAYAKAYNFYVKNNKFLNLKKDDMKLEKLDKIIERNPQHTFYLYHDIKKLKV